MDSLERPTLEQRKSWLKFRRPGDVAPGYIAILEVEPSQDQLKQVEEFVHQQWKDKTSLIIPPDDVHGPEALPRYQSATPTQSRGYKGDSESTTFRNANSDDNEKVSVHIVCILHQPLINRIKETNSSQMRNMCVNLRFRLPSGDPELLDEMEKKLPFIHVVQETATMELCSQEVNAASETVLLPVKDLHYSSTVQSELTSNGGGTFAYVLDSWGGDLPRRQNYYIEDLGGRIQKWPGRTYTTNSKSGHQDVVGHGTVVASLLGGDKHGQANKTTIIPVKVVEDNGRGNSDLMAEALCEILEHAQNEGTVSRSVVNISMSGFRVALDNLNKTVNELNRNGLLCIVASGNERQDTSLVVPASARTALTVGAVDENDKESDYSNAGKHVAVFSSGDLDSRDPACMYIITCLLEGY